MWVDLISGHDVSGRALVPRLTAAVADAATRASWNGLLEAVAPERRRRPVRRFSTFSLLELLLN